MEYPLDIFLAMLCFTETPVFNASSVDPDAEYSI